MERPLSPGNSEKCMDQSCVAVMVEGAWCLTIFLSPLVAGRASSDTSGWNLRNRKGEEWIQWLRQFLLII